MSHDLTQRLLALGLLTPTDAERPEVPCEAAEQLQRAQARQALADQLRAHWGAFLDTWASATVHEAALRATEAQRQAIAQAWAETLPGSFRQAVETLSCTPLEDALVPWVEAAATRRHGPLPMAAAALLEEWCAALDPSDPEQPRTFWAHVTQEIREHGARQDRSMAERTVAATAEGLVAVVHRHMAMAQEGWGRLKVWKRTPAAWLADLLERPDFGRASAEAVATTTLAWKGVLEPDQAFPALAMGLEVALIRPLGVQTPEDIQVLERWLAQAIEDALPAVLVERLAAPQVARLVRESLHLDAHAQSLAPAPLLTPTR